MIIGKVAVVAAVVLAASVIAARQQTLKLYVNGKLASSRVTVIDGRSYVPLTDIAGALGMQVTKRADGFDMAPSGGANEIANQFTGKVGDEIFTGKWRFTAISVDRVKSYNVTLNNLMSPSDQAMQAKDNEDLFVVTCRIKNGTPSKDELVFSNDWGTHNALTDQDENAYQPAAYDVVPTEGAPLGVTFLPGSAINFKLIFRIPTSAKPKDLIFTALRYSMRLDSDQKKDPPQDIRVALDGGSPF